LFVIVILYLIFTWELCCLSLRNINLDMFCMQIYKTVRKPNTAFDFILNFYVYDIMFPSMYINFIQYTCIYICTRMFKCISPFVYLWGTINNITDNLFTLYPPYYYIDLSSNPEQYKTAMITEIGKYNSRKFINILNTIIVM